jgi:hypothetical protein
MTPFKYHNTIVTGEILDCEKMQPFSEHCILKVGSEKTVVFEGPRRGISSQEHVTILSWE